MLLNFSAKISLFENNLAFFEANFEFDTLKGLPSCSFSLLFARQSWRLRLPRAVSSGKLSGEAGIPGRPVRASGRISH